MASAASKTKNLTCVSRIVLIRGSRIALQPPALLHCQTSASRQSESSYYMLGRYGTARNGIVLRKGCGKQGHSVAGFRGRRVSMIGINRRHLLAGSAGALAVAAFGAAPAHAANNAQDLIKAFTGGKQAVEAKVKLDLPEIAENGNTVPMTVTVESPMSEQSHVTEVLVLADGNPNAGVATFYFSPASGVAEANTRIRLAATQNIIAVAKMNDGSFVMASKQVKVTIGGCGG
jgi:sulfur-oxidizing protein SoxY